MPGRSEPAEDRLGAYGLAIRGIESHLLVRADSDWRPFELLRRVGRCGFEYDRVSRSRAELVLESGGGIVIERGPSRATFTTPVPIDDAALVHPYLGTAAAIVAHWDGREVFHAGAFVANGGGWAVLGDREAGKSTMLAGLATAGHGVLSDDIVVVAHGTVFAGPRSIDLRETSATALQAGVELGVVGARERWRLELGQVMAVAPLYGWVFLAWGDEIAVTRLRASEVLLRLTAHRAVRLPPPDPAELLRLSVLPAWELVRPRDWGQLRAAADSLLAEIARVRATPPAAG